MAVRAKPRVVRKVIAPGASTLPNPDKMPAYSASDEEWEAWLERKYGPLNRRRFVWGNDEEEVLEDITKALPGEEK